MKENYVVYFQYIIEAEDIEEAEKKAFEDYYTWYERPNGVEVTIRATGMKKESI